MHSTITAELSKYIASLNKVNEFEPGYPYDLDWRWEGNDTVPYIEVYEQADGHVLCTATESDIIEVLRDSLPDWGLGDVISYV